MLILNGRGYLFAPRKTYIENADPDPIDVQVQEMELAVYVDEAQDLTPEEIRLLLRVTRRDDSGGQTFVVFYDNAQNIYGVKPPVWHDLGVEHRRARTVFLDQCLRNTRQTLEFAFNVLSDRSLLKASGWPQSSSLMCKVFGSVDWLRNRAERWK